MIPLKSEEDLKMLREAGKILNRIIRKLEEAVKSGVSTEEIDNLAERLVAEEDCLPAFKGYRGFPASTCTSTNYVIVHGIPDEQRIKQGDILSLDLGINYKGYFSDSAVTVPVGIIDSKLEKLIKVTKQALSEGIKQAKVGNRLSNISCAIQDYVENNGFSVVRQFVGHGIGRSLHEEPEIPNFGQPDQGAVLKHGMVFAIEPMVNMGTWESEILDNGWTAVTKDRQASAHFEHTVAITNQGPEILTDN
ncbi:MAG: type I methionyl aminopeptidase [Candidatus Omnitrophica bacterium]|nr:type I methionyl aminopeptidase [Candidatus Omnitrophota bacterium]MBU1090979.1 type I methionyl aminopeptidase [Candidatus Omnitrophota bacterium]